MNRKAVWGAAFGCLVYIGALVAMLPATWVAQVVGRASGQALVLSEPAGTAWAGSGQLYARERAGSLLDLGGLRWRASLSALFRGSVATELWLGHSSPAVRMDWSLNSVAIHGLNLELPGRILAIVSPPLEAMGPQGKLRIKSDNLRLDASSASGLASIEWRPARLARAPAVDLGSHVARLRGGGRKVDIELATLEGPLRLSGAGSWTRERGLTGSGSIEHGEAAAATLGPFLQGVCSSYANRRCEFRIAQ